MTADPRQPGRRSLRLRTTLALVVLGSVAYAAGLTAFLAWRVAPAAASLQQRSAAVLDLFGDLQDRAQALAAASERAHHLMSARGDSAARAAIRALPGVMAASPRTRPAAVAAVPVELQLALGRADGDIARIQSALAEVLALDELRRYGEAGPALALLDAYRDSLSQHLLAAQRNGLRDLVARERALADASDRAANSVLWWVLAGLLFVPVVLLLLHRRLGRPLAALDEAFGRVSEGDFTARLPVERADEVGRLAGQFNRMTHVLQDRVENQGRLAAVGELLAGVAHEVSEPLMAITAQSERRLAEPDISNELRLELLRILRQARRGARLLWRVLRLARPSDGTETEVDIARVVQEAVDLVAHRCVEHEVVVDNRIELGMPRVRGDATGLEQVFVNLLGNAIDALAGRPGARRITLTSSVARDGVAITVADSGGGVAPEIAGDLFKPFTTTKAPRGSGLGLHLSRRTVRAAGGTLELASQAPQGAKFVVKLPRSVARVSLPTMAEQQPAPTAAAGGGMQLLAGIRVLVADDAESVRHEVAAHLRYRGAVVVEAEDGLTALRLLAEAPVDVIVLDLRMPRLSWLEFLSSLWRSYPDLGERVVVLSGDPGLLDEVRSLAPPERILAKPVELAVLEDRIRGAALGARR